MVETGTASRSVPAESETPLPFTGHLQQRPSTQPQLPRLSWGDPVMKPVIQAIEGTASNDLPVVIVGEIGAGKKLVARTLHARSPRAGATLTILDCRSPETDLAFDRLAGEPAESAGQTTPSPAGTIVLAGLDALDDRRQAQLVHTLDELQERPVDHRPRMVATSRVDLANLCSEGRLRQELLLHLGVVTVRVPPLRTRKSDLPKIAAELLATSSAQSRKIPDISSAAAHLLLAAPWPGNVRELRWALLRASGLAGDGPILPRHLRLDALSGPRTPTLAEVERRAIVQALADVGGHRRKAARRLGIGLRTLYDKIKRYSIDS